MPIAEEKRSAKRKALKETSGRVAELLCTVAHSRAKAAADWSVVQATAHVVTLSEACGSLVGSGSRSDLDEMIGTAIVDTVDVLNNAALL